MRFTALFGCLSACVGSGASGHDSSSAERTDDADRALASTVCASCDQRSTPGVRSGARAMPQGRGDPPVEPDMAALPPVLYENTVLPVSDCSTLRRALDGLQTVRFGSDIVVTLALAPGSYRCPQPLAVDHPQGDRIAILGDRSDPSAVVLSFDGDGIVVSGHSLGRIDGLTLRAQTPGAGVGILAMRNGDITVGPNVTIADFAVGERATGNSSIFNEGDAQAHVVIEGAEVGLRAASGGLIEASWSEIREASFVGMHATSGGIVIADHSRVQTHDLPVIAQRGGMILADGADSDTSASVGVRAERGGYISWENGSSRSAEWDYHADFGGIIAANGSSGRSGPHEEGTAPQTGIYR